MINMAGSFAQYNEIYWPWPIAVYLFAAGLASGAMIVAASLHMRAKLAHTGSFLLRAAIAMAIVILGAGLGLLVIDLDRPLHFYLLMLHFNPTSVMSIGVALISVFMLASIAWGAMIFSRGKWLSVLNTRYFCSLLIILALGLGGYTGVLLSAVSKIALWNSAVLPVLFMVSGLSSGVAALLLCAALTSKASQEEISALLGSDNFIIIAEFIALAALFIGLVFGPEQSQLAFDRIVHNYLAPLLIWVVAIGLLVPFVLGNSALKDHGAAMFSSDGARASKQKLALILSCACVLVGVLALRLYIVYVGQLVHQI